MEAFDRELDYIFATLHRLGAAPGEAEDLAQEVFVVLHRNWASVDTTRPMRPYLFGVAYRILCAHRRRRSREIPYATLDADDDRAGPEELLQNKESVSLLQAALDKVPLSRRAVVIMHELDDVPMDEVARRLSITRFGAYARLRKGLRELTTALRRLSSGGVRR